MCPDMDTFQKYLDKDMNTFEFNENDLYPVFGYSKINFG